MAKKEHEPKIKRLLRCITTIEDELAELFYLSDEQSAPLRTTVAFLKRRCETLGGLDAASSEE